MISSYKKTFITIITLLFTSLIVAQTSINYKALIKDGSGNVVANQSITVQFSILQGVAQTNVYQETQTPTTDANGIVILNIGEGTIDSGDYSTIIWGSNDHFLNVQIDTGSGLIDMGTTQFMAVPYALNVTGLETLDESNGIGWRLKGQNPTNYGNIGLNAIDLNYSNIASTTIGATGNYAAAFGIRTKASGNVSTAMGLETTASGDYATTMGEFTTASGIFSTAMGRSTNADAYASITMGRFNSGGGNPTTWVETDPLLEVGNGASSGSRTNALTILKNGTITAPTFDLAEITDAKALITKEYLEANSSTGLEALDEGNGIGWRLKGQNLANYGNIGEDAVDLSQSSLASGTYGATSEKSIALGTHTTSSGYASTAIGHFTTASGLQSTALGDYTISSGTASTAMGRNTEAAGNYSTAMGNLTAASGLNSTAIGNSTTASGDYSTAMGKNTFAIGDYSTTMGEDTGASGYAAIATGFQTSASELATTAMGFNTRALGRHSTAMGEFTLANSISSTALGRYNIGGGNPTTWVASDPLFEIGNGSFTTPSNAFTVLKNGDIGIGNSPSTNLHVFHGSNAGGDGFRIQNTGANNNWFRFYINNTSGNLNLYSNIGGGTSIGNFNDASGVYSATSDRRLKTNFNDLHFNWKGFMKLNTLTYNYKVQKDSKKHIGLIAQEVEKIYPELVSYNKENDVYHLNYSGFGVIAIKAIQEQQKTINNQNEKIARLEAALLTKDEAYSGLNNRLKKIEALLINKNENVEVVSNED